MIHHSNRHWICSRLMYISSMFNCKMKFKSEFKRWHYFGTIFNWQIKWSSVIHHSNRHLISNRLVSIFATFHCFILQTINSSLIMRSNLRKPSWMTSTPKKNTKITMVILIIKTTWLTMWFYHLVLWEWLPCGYLVVFWKKTRLFFQ